MLAVYPHKNLPIFMGVSGIHTRYPKNICQTKNKHTRNEKIVRYLLTFNLCTYSVMLS